MSLRRESLGWMFVAGVLALIFAAAYIIMVPRLQPMTQIVVGDGTFNARIAATEEERVRGLSGVAAMPDNEALLFVFPREDYWGIWMKDMKMPIDAVWLDERKQIVHIAENLTPESYREGKVFSPKKRARYVIEFNAGTVKDSAVLMNSTVRFDNIDEAR